MERSRQPEKNTEKGSNQRLHGHGDRKKDLGPGQPAGAESCHPKGYFQAQKVFPDLE